MPEWFSRTQNHVSGPVTDRPRTLRGPRANRPAARGGPTIRETVVQPGKLSCRVGPRARRPAARGSPTLHAPFPHPRVAARGASVTSIVGPPLAGGLWARGLWAGGPPAGHPPGVACLRPFYRLKA